MDSTSSNSTSSSTSNTTPAVISATATTAASTTTSTTTATSSVSPPSYEIVTIPWTCPKCTYLVTESYYRCYVCMYEDNVYHIENKGQTRMNANKTERLRLAFGTASNIILPVLACHTVEQYQKNISYLANYRSQNLIHGVWLVSSNCSSDTIENVVRWMKTTYPDFWVGVNLLGENIFFVFSFLTRYNVNGLWLDRSYVTEDDEQTVPNIIVDQLARREWNGLYFGGVLFKYIPEKGDPKKVLRNAIPYMDVLCTTGTATGVSITPEKLEMVTTVLNGDIPIAIASGISSKSVGILKNKIQVYMFRDAIVDKKEDVVPEMLDAVLQAIHRSH